MRAARSRLGAAAHVGHALHRLCGLPLVRIYVGCALQLFGDAGFMVSIKVNRREITGCCLDSVSDVALSHATQVSSLQQIPATIIRCRPRYPHTVRPTLGYCHATALRPFFATSVNSFSEAPPWPLLSAFPLTHQAGSHVELAREHRLARPFSKSELAKFLGGHLLDRRKAHLVERPHGLFRHDPGPGDIVQCGADETSVARVFLGAGLQVQACVLVGASAKKIYCPSQAGAARFPRPEGWG